MSAVLVGIADILVAVLLVATIATSITLSRRIASMKADEATMRQQIGELVSASERAERAVAMLRETVAESERSLAARIRAAETERVALDAAALGARGTAGRMDAIAAIGRKVADAVAPPAPVVAVPAPLAAPQPAASGSAALRAAVAAAAAMADRTARRNVA